MRIVRTRLRLVQRLHDGGNMHGRRYGRVDEQERKSDDGMVVEFAVCSRVSLFRCLRCMSVLGFVITFRVV